MPSLSVTTGTVVVVRLLGIMQNAELQAFDLGLRWRPAESKDTRITLVEITENDIQNTVGYPISDGKLAEIIETLQAYGPRVIGLDIFRDQPMDEEYSKLESVLSSTPNLVGISKIKDTPILPPLAIPEERVGFADAVIDDDGFLRRSQLGDEDGEGQYGISFTVRLVEQYLRDEGISLENGIRVFDAMRFGETEIPHFRQNMGSYVWADSGGNQTLINYRAGEQPFDSVSYSEILSGSVDANILSDRILFVGYTAKSIKDFQNSRVLPTYEPSLVPGIAIQAHAVSQILSAYYDGRPLLRTLPEVLEYGLIIAVGLLGTALLRYRQRPILQFIVTISVNALLILIYYFSIVFAWWLPIIPMMLAFSFNAVILYPFYFAQALLQSKVKEKEALIEQTFDIIHNDSLQIVAIMLSSWQEGETITSDMRDKMDDLNRKLRSIRRRLNQEVFEEKLTVGEEIIDINIPLHLILQQVYDAVGLEYRSFFKSVYRDNNIVPIDDSSLSENEKRAISGFLKEAMVNVRKHGEGVTQVNVEVMQEEAHNIVRVTDNGKGYQTACSDVNSQQHDKRPAGDDSVDSGNGTRRAKQLASQLRGTFSRRKKVPHGAICELRWPIRKPFLRR